MVWSHSGSGADWYIATSTVAVPHGFGDKGWVRADLDVDNGSSGWTVTFYTSTDEKTWTALGSPVTTGTVAAVYGASTAGFGIANINGASNAPAGKIYEYKIFNGIGSTTQTLVLAWCAGDTWASGVTAGYLSGCTDICGNVFSSNAASITLGFVGAPTLNVRNASVSGKALTYFDDTSVAGRFAKMNTGRIDLTFLSLSHNEAGTYNSIGGDWYAQNFMNLLTMTRVNAPYGGVVLVGQNPKTPYPGVRGSVNAWHADRIRALNDLAAAGNHGWIDAYEALAVDVATYVDPDAVHPTIAGYDLWAAVAWAYMEQA